VLDWFQNLWSLAQAYFLQNVLSSAMAVQIAVIAGAILLTHQLSGGMRAWLSRRQAQYETNPEAVTDLATLLTFAKVIDAFLAFLLVVLAYIIADHFSWPRNELFAAGILLIALTLKRLFTDEMRKRFWAKILAMFIWGYAFLLASFSLFDSIDLWQRFLEGVAFQLGQVHISLLQVNRAFFLLLALYWVSKNLRVLSHFWLTAKSELVPAAQILFCIGSAACCSFPPVSSSSYITWGSTSPSSPCSAAPWAWGWVSACKKSLPTW